MSEPQNLFDFARMDIEAMNVIEGIKTPRLFTDEELAPRIAELRAIIAEQNEDTFDVDKENETELFLHDRAEARAINSGSW